jgi:hypothetical protein
MDIPERPEDNSSRESTSEGLYWLCGYFSYYSNNLFLLSFAVNRKNGTYIADMLLWVLFQKE